MFHWYKSITRCDAAGNLDSGVDVLPALVECSQPQLNHLLMSTAAVDQLDGDVAKLVHLRRQSTPFSHQLLHAYTINQSINKHHFVVLQRKKTLAFHRLFSRVVLSTSHVHQDMFSTFHVNLDQLIPSQLTSSLINRNSGISGKGFYSYMRFPLINQQ